MSDDMPLSSTENKEEDTIGNPRIRKRKSPSRESKEKKDKTLDDEGLTGTIKKIHSDTIEEFFCFRCNENRSSKNKYEWNTSAGVKIICNGCNGNLLSNRPKPVKVPQEASDPADRPLPTSAPAGGFRNGGRGGRGGRGGGGGRGGRGRGRGADRGGRGKGVGGRSS